MQRIRSICITLIAALAFLGFVQAPATAQERFEITSIKAVRPMLLETINALEQRDAARAKELFEAYDSAWNGIESYVNNRSRAMYDLLEHDFQPRITKALAEPSPNFAAVLADVQTMLAKFDEMVGMIAAMPPLNALFDDVARLRIVRAHLRKVNPALKAGNIAKARKSFEAFDDNWDSIEDLIKTRSADAYAAIERGMIEIEQALMSDKPDIDKVSALVNEIMRPYNAALAEVAKEARSRR
jgi:high-affinity iron transporter